MKHHERDRRDVGLERSLELDIDLKGEDNRSLSEPEVEALWELAGQGTESLRSRFLDEAVREPLSLRQLQARSQPALIAALGLDPDRRASATRLLVRRLEKPGLSLEDEVAMLGP